MSEEFTKQADREATTFAMELLMPENFVRDEVVRIGAYDLTDDRWVKALANKFKVPMTLMAIRIGELRERGIL